ncbi:G patch domain-containing protein 1-like [Mya arenaria]|uniref:G patch domain-containing protein 1-like n=1 Tax=Mya arenaria TaxID=6604 RepID=UPI0022E90FF4|nr:G patch domain-containing protein 1-like [Mya arenaria]
MAAHSDSDEDETFVSIGTALDVPDKDEPVKKPITVQDMSVKDSKGRVRFHGAFTGGFSAGYFNTVGSREGFTPSTFVSSREKRTDGSGSGQRPEDFMDEEDISEHGIAPRKFVTSAQFTSEERKKRTFDEAKLATADSILGGDTTLLNLIVPERITVGVRLLRKMGWKEGQGVGPRLSRKQKQAEGRRIYGCTGPPSPDSGDDGLDDETVLSDVTFAPTDTAHILLGAKDNTHGLGYSGLDPRKALPSTHINLFEAPTVRKSGASRRGIRGQGFGVGALEDEDDDVYGMDDMSKYDMTMGGEGDDKFGWTAPTHRGQKQQTPVGYVGQLLDGFSLSSKKLVQKKDFPPPSLPRDFRPVHRFKKSDDQSIVMTRNQSSTGVDYRQFLKPSDAGPSPVPGTSSSGLVPGSAPGSVSQGSSAREKRHDATSRGVALGEQAFVGSVFDLIPKEEKERINQAKQNTDTTAIVNFPLRTFVSSETLEGSEDQPKGDNSTTTESTSNVEEHRKSGVPLFQGAAIFKPFSKDPAKQLRYDKYLEAVKHGHKEPYLLVGMPGKTDWEKEREREEFSKAAHLYRPLASMMAARFTRAGTIEDGEEDVKAEQKIDQTDAEKAASMKMYGKLTREDEEWHPDNLVCKRFNVPNPYPGSTIVGLISAKRDKYSVFNFLNFANPTEMAYDRRGSQTQETPPPEEVKKDNAKTDTDKTDTTSKVDKELNKGKAMKSIFSHLIDAEKGAQKASNLKSDKPVSFSVKSVQSNKPKEFKSIFSHLEKGENTVKPAPVAMETDNDENAADAGKTAAGKSVSKTDKFAELVEKSETDGAPAMDLFRAIFRNTDSEDSSSSEEEDGEDSSSKLPDAQDSSFQPAFSISDSVEATPATSLPGFTAPPKQSTLAGCGSFVALPPEISPMETGKGSAGQPQDSSGDESDAYGPALPPSLPQGAASASNDKWRDLPAGDFIDLTNEKSRNQPAGDIIDLTNDKSKDRPPDDYVDLTKESTKKHKHRHRDKHKHKKEKKEKRKKSKHKKKGRKKEKRSRHVNERSDSSEREESSDEDDRETDKEIINRLKLLKSAQRQRAVDFM